MSIKVMSAVWDKAQVSNTKLLLLLAIADFANEDGEAWPSVDTLANKTRQTGRAVLDMLQELERAGEIEELVTIEGRTMYHVCCYNPVPAKSAQIPRKNRAKSGDSIYVELSEPPEPSGSQKDYLPDIFERVQAQQASYTVPGESGGANSLGDELADILSQALGIGSLPDKKRRHWGKTITGIVQQWHATPADAVSALRALLDPKGEMKWKKYSSPFQRSFADDYGMYLGRACGTPTSQELDPGGVI